MQRRIFAAIALSSCLLLCLSPARAGGFEEGMAAYARGDYGAAFAVWLPLAEAGDAAAQYAVGKMYQRGTGAPRGYAEAMDWYKKSAGRGYPYALYGLGTMYDLGQGMTRDKDKAMSYYEQAAEYQVPEAQMRLAEIYSKGSEWVKDNAKAYFWAAQAAANRFSPAELRAKAADLRNSLENRLTRWQLKEVQDAAVHWKPKDYVIASEPPR